MQKAKNQILSTVALGKELIDEASVHGILIDEIPFIETKQIESESVINKIENYSHQIITAIFTSLNAVSAVVNYLKQKPAWKVYCIGNRT